MIELMWSLAWLSVALAPVLLRKRPIIKSFTQMSEMSRVVKGRTLAITYREFYK